MILAALVLVASAGAGDLEQRARKSEEAAFIAVDEKRWCDALALFLESDGLVASPDLIFNAAQAAELGADRARAMQLYTQLLGTTTSADRKSEAKKRIAALTKMVEKEGPGVACPMPVAAAGTVDPATPPPAAAVAPPEGPATAPAPAPVPPTSPWPWVTAGVGAAAVATGAVIVVVGAQSWFAHAAAREALLAAEKQGSTDGVEELYAEQERARADWVGFGQASVAAGIAFAVVGALAAAGGAVWGVTEGGAE